MSEWRKEVSNVKLAEIEFESSEGFVIERKNIVSIDRADIGTGEIRTEYECLMRFLPIQKYLNNVEIVKVDLNETAEFATMNALDKDELAEMLVFALEKIAELEGKING